MILLVGTNMSEAHPVAATFVKDAVLGGAKLIVIDPRRTDMVDFADSFMCRLKSVQTSP